MNILSKICSHCEKYLPIDQYNSNGKNTKRSNCKECQSKYVKEYNKNYKEKNGIHRVTELRGASYENYLKMISLRNAKCRAKRKSLDFNLTLNFLKNLYNNQNGVCALSGISLTWNTNKGYNKTNISLDRIDNTKGYTKDNVRLVCYQTNVMKQDLEDSELLYYCTQILQRHKHVYKTS